MVLDCDRLDAEAQRLQAFVTTQPSGLIPLLCVLVLASTFLVLRGARWGRALGTLAAVVIGLGSVYAVTAASDDCTLRLVGAAAGAVAGAVVAMCCLRRVGAAALTGTACGLVAHAVYRALPVAMPESPAVAGQPVPYVATVAVAVVSGVGVACCYASHLAAAATSMVGGCGYAYVTHLSVERASNGNHTLPPLAAVVIVLVASVGGTAWQLRRTRLVLSTTNPSTHPNAVWPGRRGSQERTLETPVASGVPIGMPVETIGP